MYIYVYIYIYMYTYIYKMYIHFIYTTHYQREDRLEYHLLTSADLPPASITKI